MNLKQAFYTNYYNGIDFRKFSKEEKRENNFIKRLAENIEKSNAQKYDNRNRNIFSKSFDKTNFTYLDLSALNLPNYNSFQLSTTYPGLLTGIGMVHETNNQGELKLGFFFDHTSGLPMLPGSSVKGAIRGAFPNFRSKSNNPTVPDLTEPKKKEDQAYLAKQKAKAKFIALLFPPFNHLVEQEQTMYNKVHQLELAIFEGLDLPKKIAKPEENGMLSMSKRCRFLDAIIVQSHNKNKQILGIDALTPHGKNSLKNPIPLPFLKVLPSVVFQFQFMIPKIVFEEENFENESLKELFKNILLHLGMGAKTNVGYGQFEEFEEILFKEGQKLQVTVIGLDINNNKIIVKVEGQEGNFEVGGGKKGKVLKRTSIGDKLTAYARKPNLDGSLNNISLNPSK